MMNWKPTPGLKLAESVLQDIMNAAIACGMPPITNPEFRHGAKQIIANALDGFRRNADVSEFLEERDDVALILRNGSATDGDWQSPATEPEPYAPIVQGDTAKDASVTAPKKRSRGRPKLSVAEKKKRKAAKQANAVEAEAAT